MKKMKILMPVLSILVIGVVTFFCIKAVSVKNIEIVSKRKVTGPNYLGILGETYEFDIKQAPYDAKKPKVKWISSDEKVATVKDGQVTICGYGECTITAKTKNGVSDSITFEARDILYNWKYAGTGKSGELQIFANHSITISFKNQDDKDIIIGGTWDFIDTNENGTSKYIVNNQIVDMPESVELEVYDNKLYVKYDNEELAVFEKTE